MAMNKQRKTSNILNPINYDSSGNVTIPQIGNATTDTDKFIVSDVGTVKYRTGVQVLSDIGAQGALTITTVGTTGAATLVGNTLNIPIYSSAAVVPQSRTLTINGTAFDLTADRTWSVGTVTSIGLILGTTGTDIAVSGSPVTGSGSITINIPTASATNRGALSAADWTTFNDKQPAGNYITALTGEATATGPGSVVITLSNAAVIGKLLNGLTITGSAITSSDSILAAMGKLQNQINGLTGSLIYKGSWNAATNTPTINSGVGVAGNFYIVTTPGSTTIDGVSSWAVGDWIIFSGAVWQKVPNTNAVVSVNTYTGAVTLVTDDIQEDASPTNLWFTNLRAQAAITGGASTIVTADLTVSRALISNASGKVAVSAVTSAELAFVSGVTSAIQTQLNGKEPTIAAAASDPTLKYWRGDKTWQTLPVYTFNSLSPMTTLGDIIYGAASGAGTRLAGNTTANRRFLRQTGTGTVSAAPAWDALVDGDIPNNSAQAGSVANSITFKADGTGDAANVVYNGGAAKTVSYNSIGAQAASAKLTSLAGLTFASTSFVKMTAANTFELDTTTYFTLVSTPANRVLASPNGSAGVPAFRALVAADIPALPYVSNPMTTLGDIIYGGASGAVTRLAGSTSSSKRFLTQTGDGTLSAAPAWGALASGDIPNNAANTTGSAATLTTARTLTIGATGKTFDGSANRTWTLAEIGAQAAFGDQNPNKVYAGPASGTADAAPTFRALVAADIPALSYLSSSASSTQSGYFGDIFLYDDSTPSHYLGITNSANLTAARTLSINVNDADRTISLSGSLTVSAAATISGTNTGDQTDISGNAATATKLATARAINGVNFDGSAAITITANTGTSLTFNDGGAGAASGTTFNGGTARTISYNTIGAQPAGSYQAQLNGTGFVKANGTTITYDNSTYLTTSAAASTYQPVGSYVTIGGYQQITGYKEFASYGSSNKTGFLCNNATTGFMFFQNVSTGKTWDWEILSNGSLGLNESGVNPRLTIAAGGATTIGGSVTATSFFESSDIRLKNVMERNPDISLDIDLVKYSRKEDGKIRYGYIAQEVQEIIPELVNDGEFLTLNYSDVHSLKIAALERRIKELESKLAN
jgi:hypothetical protein